MKKKSLSKDEIKFKKLFMDVWMAFVYFID